MTREEIIERKKQLSIDIAEAISEFEQDTNVQVTGIDLDISIARTILGTVWEKRTSVDVYLKNPYED